MYVCMASMYCGDPEPEFIVAGHCAESLLQHSEPIRAEMDIAEKNPEPRLGSQSNTRIGLNIALQSERGFN